METELKFQVPAASRDALRRTVATASARTTRLQAIYYETPGQRLAAAGLALRLRKEGRIWVQTLKGRGDGMLTRLEHEVRLAPQTGTPQLDVQRHAGTPAGDALRHALAGAGALQPLYRSDVRRLHRRVRVGGAQVEIAYDRGHLVAGARQLPIDEVEFELVSGDAAALVALARRWALRFGLWWDMRPKSERGQRLALDQAAVPATRARPPGGAADAGPAAVRRAALQAALAQAGANAAEIASGASDAEDLHQLRVALRRLRTVLRVYAGWGGGDAEALEAAWREPFARLGAARDVDAIAQSLRPGLAAAGAPAFDWPAPAAAPDPADVVRSAEFNDLMLRTLALALPAPEPETQTLAAAADEALQRAWRAVRSDARAYAEASAERRHRLRKRLKRLRYALEMLPPLYKPRATRRFLGAVARGLDLLGQLNDIEVADALCREHAASEPAAWFAVGWLAAQRDALQARAAGTLKKLLATRRPWRDGPA